MKYLVIFYLLIFTAFATFAYAQSPEITPNENPTPVPHDFRSGETLSNPLFAVIIESLGALLIVLFIVIYAIKRKAKGISKYDSN